MLLKAPCRHHPTTTLAPLGVGLTIAPRVQLTHSDCVWRRQIGLAKNLYALPSLVLLFILYHNHAKSKSVNLLFGNHWEARVRHRFVSDLTARLSGLVFVAENEAKVANLVCNQAGNT